MRRAELLARIRQLKLVDLITPKTPMEPAFDPEPETICFRSQTIAIVRHFFEISCQMGRIPSIMGREFFRARVSHHALPSFEEQVVFVHDIESCLRKLHPHHAQMIAMVGLYGFSKEEVAAVLRRCRDWVNENYLEALDALTQIFLDAGVLSAARPDRKQWQMSETSRRRSGHLPPKKPCARIGVAVTATSGEQVRPALQSSKRGS